MKKGLIVLGLSFVLFPFLIETSNAKSFDTHNFEQKVALALLGGRPPSMYNRSFGRINPTGIPYCNLYPRHSSLGSRFNPWNRGVITGYTPPPHYNNYSNLYYPSSTGFSFRNIFNRNKNIPYYSSNNFNNSNGVWNNHGSNGIQIFSNGVPNSSYYQDGFNYIDNEATNGGATVKIID